jgi:hypothetical protein
MSKVNTTRRSKNKATGQLSLNFQAESNSQYLSNDKSKVVSLFTYVEKQKSILIKEIVSNTKSF